MPLPDLCAAVRRGDALFRWVPLAGTELEVMADAVRLDGVRVPVSARRAQQIADLLSAIDPDGWTVSLPTPATVDAVFAQASLRPPPFTFWVPGRDIAEYRWALEHSRFIDEWLLVQGATPELLVAPVGKDWVLTDSLTSRRAATYGWHRAGKSPIQPLSYTHNPDHHDYSQVLRLLRVPPGAAVPGRGKIQRQPGVELPPVAPAGDDPRPLALRALEACLAEAQAQGCDVTAAVSAGLPSRAAGLPSRAAGLPLDATRLPVRAEGRVVPPSRVAEYLRGCERGGSSALGKWLAAEVLRGHPQPFCAAAQGWAEGRVARPGESRPPWRAAVHELRADADAGRRGPFLPADALRAGGALPSPGDLALFTRGPAGSGQGHVERVVSATTKAALTIGANERGGRWVLEELDFDDVLLLGFCLETTTARRVAPSSSVGFSSGPLP